MIRITGTKTCLTTCSNKWKIRLKFKLILFMFLSQFALMSKFLFVDLKSDVNGRYMYTWNWTTNCVLKLELWCTNVRWLQLMTHHNAWQENTYKFDLFWHFDFCDYTTSLILRHSWGISYTKCIGTCNAK